MGRTFCSAPEQCLSCEPQLVKTEERWGISKTIQGPRSRVVDGRVSIHEPGSDSGRSTAGSLALRSNCSSLQSLSQVPGNGGAAGCFRPVCVQCCASRGSPPADGSMSLPPQ